jgi:hypothetical protein
MNIVHLRIKVSTQSWGLCLQFESIMIDSVNGKTHEQSLHVQEE